MMSMMPEFRILALFLAKIPNKCLMVPMTRNLKSDRSFVKEKSLNESSAN